MKYGITWSNDEESVCQTGYVYDSIEAADDAGVAGLKLGAKLSDEEGTKALGTQIDGMNDPEHSQEVKYAVIQTEDDDIHTLVLTDENEGKIIWKSSKAE